MVTKEDRKKEFSERFITVLDAYGVATHGKNRFGDLAAMFEVSSKGARKWVVGESIPETTKLIEIVEKLKEKVPGLTVEWLLTGNTMFLPAYINKTLNIEDNRIEEINYRNEQLQSIVKLQKINWEQLSIFLNSDNKDKEFEIMPTNKIEVSASAFMIEIEQNHASGYVREGDIIIIDPETPLKNDCKVIALINGQAHILRYEKIEKELLYPLTGSSAIELTESLDYKIIGCLVWIVPKGRTP